MLHLEGVDEILKREVYPTNDQSFVPDKGRSLGNSLSFSSQQNMSITFLEK